jgi:hypothetical protein
MNQNDFKILVESTMESCKKTLVKKREEYVNDPNIDVLSNFKNNAELSIVGTPEGIGWELMTKHLQSIKDYCEGRKVGSEVLDEKIGDAINYLVLIKAVISEREGFGIDAVNEAVNDAVNEVVNAFTLEQMEEIGKNNIGNFVRYVGKSNSWYVEGNWYRIVKDGEKGYAFGIEDESDDYMVICNNPTREQFLRKFDFHNIRPKND